MHFNFQKSRIDCCVAFIFGIIQAHTVNLSQVAWSFNSSYDAAYKRLQRFIREVSINCSQLANLIASIVGLDNQDPWRLIFDRTNWKLGKKHINILYLAVAKDGIAIPLFFTFINDKKSGNSNQGDRIFLLNKFIKTFGKKSIELILGDREFIGVKWLSYLIKEKIEFCFRLKDNWQLARTQNSELMELRKHFRGLKLGQSKSLGLCELGSGKSAVSCYITGIRTISGEWVIVAHSENLENPCEIYRDRWQIETMFRALKTGGFNIEDTHVTDANRLECLFSVVSIAYAICYKLGKIVIQEKPPKLKKHGYKPRSIIRYGLNQLKKAIALLSRTKRPFRRIMSQIFGPIRLNFKKIVL